MSDGPHDGEPPPAAGSRDDTKLPPHRRENAAPSTAGDSESNPSPESLALKRIEVGLKRIEVGLGIPAALILLVPGLVYGSGYLLWIAPSLHLYGNTIGRQLGVSSLILPGITYTTVLGIGAIGSAIYIRMTKKAKVSPLRAVIHCGIGALTMFLAGLLSEAFAKSEIGEPRHAVQLVYFIGHLFILGASFVAAHDLYRLVRAPDKSRLEASLISVPSAAVFVVLQFQLAVTYGAFGPNPVQGTRAVLLVRDVLDQGRVIGTERSEYIFIERTTARTILYDPSRLRFIEIPTLGTTIEYLQYSSRQRAFLQVILDNPVATRADIDRSFKGARATLVEREIRSLSDDGLVLRSGETYSIVSGARQRVTGYLEATKSAP